MKVVVVVVNVNGGYFLLLVVCYESGCSGCQVVVVVVNVNYKCTSFYQEANRFVSQQIELSVRALARTK